MYLDQRFSKSLSFTGIRFRLLFRQERASKGAVIELDNSESLQPTKGQLLILFFLRKLTTTHYLLFLCKPSYKRCQWFAGTGRRVFSESKRRADLKEQRPILVGQQMNVTCEWSPRLLWTFPSSQEKTTLLSMLYKRFDYWHSYGNGRGRAFRSC